MEALNLKVKPKKGTTLIEASAGTGKTYSISNLFLHFILEGQKVSEILVVTFTEAATKELRERIRENLSLALAVFHGEKEDELISTILALYEDQAQKIESAILNFDESAIYTIHGFCQRMLQENAFESSCLFDAELLTDDKPIVEELVNDFWRREIYTKSLVLPTGFNKETLLNFTRSYQGQKLVPELSLDWENQEQNFKGLCEQWQAQHEEAMELLRVSKALARRANAYKLVDLEQDYERLNDFFEAGELTDLPLKAFSLFSQSTISQAKKPASKEEAPTHSLFGAIESFSQYFTPFAVKQKFAQYYLAEFAKRKLEKNVLTFDDLIEQLFDVLKKKEQGAGPLHERIREKYKTALVDEFQDTDPKQYDIFESLFGQKSTAHSFYMIGDPKQSIYAFRGADIFAYLKAKNKAEHSLTLDTNYRSEAGMVDAVNTFFLSKGSEQAFAYAPQKELEQEGITFEAVRSGAEKRVLKIEGDAAPMQLRWCENDAGEAQSKSAVTGYFQEAVCKEIVDLLNLSQAGEAYFLDPKTGEKSRVQPGDIAILVNKHKEAQDLLASLNRQGLAAVIQKSGNIFDSSEAKDTLRFLHAVMEPNDNSITALLLTSFFNFTAKELKERTDEETLDLLSDLIDYQKNWSFKGFLSSFQDFLIKHKVQESFLERSSGERAMSNLLQIREILHEAEGENSYGLSALARFLNEKINSDDRDDERYFQRLETDAEAIQIMTIHKSKGLEFPIVFVPYMWGNSYEASSRGKGAFNQNGDFPFNAEGQMAYHIDAKSDDRKEARWQWQKEQLGEQLRQLYVALTRSANRCYLYWGKMKNEPSLFSYLACPEIAPEDMSFPENKYLDEYLSKRKEHWQEVLASSEHISFQEFYDEACAELVYKEEREAELAAPKEAPDGRSNWQIGSYSGLTRNHSKVETAMHNSDQPGTDESIGQADLVIQNEEQVATGFYAFPRSARVGIAIHEIFEYMDFQDSTDWPKVIEERLLKYRFAGDFPEKDRSLLDQRIADVHEMLCRVIETQLMPCNFALKDIRSDQRIDEMEFYFPIANIALKDLQQCFRKHYPAGHENDVFAEDLAQLNYQMQEGFLSGAIDLSFEKDGKFYVLDWKTNHMGNQSIDYSPEKIKKKIRESFYFLQYHLYTVALHLYLEQNLEGYDYDQNFGGIIYAFVRGFEQGTENGIHWDRLPKGLVDDLTALFMGTVEA